nr:FkbM family methyltransferase [Nocardioides perillae]
MPTSRRTRAVIVQFEPVHEEVAEALRSALEALGVEVTIYLNERALSRGPLYGGMVSGERVHYRQLDDAEGRDALALELADFDVLVLNTFQRNGHASWARRLGLPTLGLVHNPPLLLSQQECVDLVRSGQAVLATLAPHCTAALMLADHRLFGDTVTLSHTMWHLPDPPRSASGKIRIGLPGAATFRNRDFEGVVTAAAGLSPTERDRVEFAVLGAGHDRTTLEQMVREAGLDDTFWFAPVDPATGFVQHDVTFGNMAGSDYLLPALPPDRSDYRTTKITSAVPASVAFAVPAILDRWTAAVYDIPCIDHPVDQLQSGVSAALALGEDSRRDLVDQLRRRRERDVEANVAQTRRALERLDGERGAPRSGARDRGAGRDTAERNGFLRFVAAALPHSYAQRFQDLWALWETGFAQEGYFVEFGALNGRDVSNTYLLEQLGWTGAVAEPHPAFADAVRRNRSCHVSTKCVLDVSGRTVEFHAVNGRPALSTASGFGEGDEREALRADHVVHHVETTTLEDLLVEAGAPHTIDFLSVDTEGSEVAILRAFDFSARRVERICVEHNEHQRDELHALLTEQGYRRKWPDLSGHDDWYVHESVSARRSPAAQAALLHRVRTVPPAVVGWHRRRALAESLVPAGTTVASLPGTEPNRGGRDQRRSAMTRTALTRNTTRQVARANGLDEEVYARRVRAAFRRLCRAVEPEQAVEIGSDGFGFAAWASREIAGCQAVALDLGVAGQAPPGVQHVTVHDATWRTTSASAGTLRDVGTVLRVDGGHEALRVLDDLRDLLPSCDVVGVVITASSDERPSMAGHVARVLTDAGLHLVLADIPTGDRTMQVFVHERIAGRPVVARNVAKALRPAADPA